MPRPPPRSRWDSGKPSARSATARSATFLAAAHSGPSDVICEPTCTCTPMISRPAASRRARNTSAASSSGTPNLLVFRPVLMCGWLCASTSGFTRSATRTRRPWASGQRIDPVEFAGRFGVDRLQVERDRPFELLRRLADPGEDDLVGPEPGTYRQRDLADGIGVGMRAPLANQACDGERRIRLQRVVHRVRPARSRPVPAASAARRRETTGAL